MGSCLPANIFSQNIAGRDAAWNTCGMGLRIKPHLTNARVSQAELAARIGKTPGFISNLINGNREASPQTLRDIAAALNVRVSDLLEPQAALQEAGVAFVGASPSESRVLCRALKLDATHPEIVEARRDVPALGIVAGDRLVVDLAPNVSWSGLVLATVSHADGSAETNVYRHAAPWLFGGDSLASPPLRTGSTVAIMATVLAVYRDTRPNA